MDILRALWKSKCTDISILLDYLTNRSNQHLPMRQKYGEQIKEIEKCHMYACKKALSVN